MKSQSG